MRINSRRYGASVGGREGANDIRLHGRPWESCVSVYRSFCVGDATYSSVYCCFSALILSLM